MNSCVILEFGSGVLDLTVRWKFKIQISMEPKTILCFLQLRNTGDGFFFENSLLKKLSFKTQPHMESKTLKFCHHGCSQQTSHDEFLVLGHSSRIDCDGRKKGGQVQWVLWKKKRRVGWIIIAIDCWWEFNLHGFICIFKGTSKVRGDRRGLSEEKIMKRNKIGIYRCNFSY